MTGHRRLDSQRLADASENVVTLGHVVGRLGELECKQNGGRRHPRVRVSQHGGKRVRKADPIRDAHSKTKGPSQPQRHGAAKPQPNAESQVHRRDAMTAEKNERQPAGKILPEMPDSNELHCDDRRDWASYRSKNTRAEHANRGIREIRGRRSLGWIPFRVFRVFRGLLLCPNTFSACAQVGVLHCDDPSDEASYNSKNPSENGSCQRSGCGSDQVTPPRVLRRFQYSLNVS